MRIALQVEYDGSGFYGWQSQQNLLTVQGTLTEALSKIADEPIAIFCAGRTDAGVHATGQIIHFDTKANRSIGAWINGTNANLPKEIVIRLAQIVDETFHARFSAIARTYHYIIDNRSVRSAILASRCTWYPYPLDEIAMQEAGNYLLGEHDFTSYRSSQCESKTPMRNITLLKVSRFNHFIILEITANAFLHHMVRNIVGVLIKIGEGKKPAAWAKDVLLAKDRRQGAETSSPAGLYLTYVTYPKAYAFFNENSKIYPIF